MKREGQQAVTELEEYVEAKVPWGSLAVLGDPVHHSLSPVMHNAALEVMRKRGAGLEGWSYRAIPVSAESIGRAVEVLHGAGFAGLNLTLPHKVGVWPYLEEVDAISRAMGAANTLVRTATGFRGTNTDGYGIVQALREALGCEVAGADIWMYGAGGAARGIAVACLEADCGRLTVVNRSAGRLRELGEQLQRLEKAERLRLLPLAEAPMDARAGAIVINATSLGLRAEDPSPIGEDFLARAGAIYDTTYGCANQLGALARRHGIAYADGLSMLVWQGVRSLEIWTGEKVPAEVMRAAAEEELKRRQSR